jgi:hypothetical protein
MQPKTEPKGHGKKPRPFVVCHVAGCAEWVYVSASGLWWKLPPRWSWVTGSGGLCPAHALRPSGPVQDDAPACPDCGGIMARTGKCHTCPNCGHNDGCG